MKPDWPIASVDGLAKVTFPVSVKTKFWLASKSNVTDPVLLVSVSVLPRCAAVNVLFVSFATMSASYAWTSEPIAKPKAVRAALADELPVPPSAIARSVMPLIEPPLIVLFCKVCVAVVLILHYPAGSVSVLITPAGGAVAVWLGVCIAIRRV